MSFVVRTEDGGRFIAEGVKLKQPIAESQLRLSDDIAAAQQNRNRALSPIEQAAGYVACVKAFEHNGIETQPGERYLAQHGAVLSAPQNSAPVCETWPVAARLRAKERR